MQEDARRLYNKLVFSGECLKQHVVKIPSLISWNDIDDKSKYEAMMILATDGTIETQPYWDMSGPDQDGPNWIAKWFLHRQFKKRNTSGQTRHSEAHALDLGNIFVPRTGLKHLASVARQTVRYAGSPLRRSMQRSQPPGKCFEPVRGV